MSPFSLGSLQLLCFVWGIFCRVFCLPLELAADFFPMTLFHFVFRLVSLSSFWCLLDFWIYNPSVLFSAKGSQNNFLHCAYVFGCIFNVGSFAWFARWAQAPGSLKWFWELKFEKRPNKAGVFVPIIWLILPLQGGLSEPLEIFFMEENSLWWCWHHHYSTSQFFGDHAELGIRFRPQRMPGLCASPLIHLISLLTDLLLPSFCFLLKWNYFSMMKQYYFKSWNGL